MFGALNRADGKIGFIQVRHEEMAAFMASAYAKFTGELGVCIATSGPGASHLLTGLYDARLDHMPVLAIVGQQARTALGGHYQQEVDLRACSRTWPATSCSRPPRRRRSAIWSTAPSASRSASAKRHGADPSQRPAGTALRGPAAQAWHGPLRRRLSRNPKIVPYEADLRRAAEVLNAGKKVAMLVGAGALERPTR